MAKTAAVFFADGFEEIEGLSPVDYLRRAGVEVTTVGVVGKSFNDTMIVTSSHKIPIITDTTLDVYLAEHKDNLPDCVVCPGGSVGADNLAATPDLLAFLEKCFDAGKLTSAICASPAVVFGKTKITAGKKWTCYPGMETCAKEEYLSKYENNVFVTDGNVVTGRGPGASEQFAMELVRILAGSEVYKKVHDSSQQR
ncbi:MAG: DJ-1/PfpI family protein [Treponema sp.]|nr:DJ-1/PfpI family protein [Treponema sp.]